MYLLRWRGPLQVRSLCWLTLQLPPICQSAFAGRIAGCEEHAKLDSLLRALVAKWCSLKLVLRPHRTDTTCLAAGVMLPQRANNDTYFYIGSEPPVNVDPSAPQQVTPSGGLYY